MKLFSQLLVLGLAAEVTIASSWFSNSVYNKWHETELERWLSDNDVPYPTPADRKDLENLVKTNWQSNIATPYHSWDSKRLQSFLKHKGVETKEVAEDNTQGLIAEVKKHWYEAEDKAEDAWSSVKDWIFDSWTDSQLKAFADKHGIPVPQPRKRDTLIQKLRANYETLAKKAGETASYPGNWIYETWSESDLKEFLDSHGIPAPQPSSRDKLIASVRRNARVAGLKMADTQASASASAKAATQTLTDKLLESWSDSQIKKWADENGIKVPQGSKRNELLAIARKHRAELTGNNVSASASSAAAAASKSAESAASIASKSGSSAASVASKSAESAASVASKSAQKAASEASKSGGSVYNQASKSAQSAASVASKSAESAASEASKTGGSLYGAATSKVAQYASKASNDAEAMASDAFDSAIASWSDSRLKAFLDARGIPVPQNGKKDELVAAVRLHAHKAASGWSAWTYDTWTYDNLKSLLASSGNAAAEKAAEQAGATRDDLVSAAQHYYAEASKSSGPAYASVTSYLAKATDAAKDSTFETWSESELKSYLDSYGVPVPQGTTTNKLRAYARNQANYFKYGTTTPQGTLWVKLQQGASWVMNQLSIGAAAGRKQAAYQGQKAADAVAEGATKATNRAEEAAQRLQHKIKEEL